MRTQSYPEAFPKLTILLVVLILLSVTSEAAQAQQLTILLGSGSSVPGGTVALDLSLTTSGSAQPAVVQWTMNYSAADIASVTVTDGPTSTAASKSISCSSTPGNTVCIAYGVNQNIIGDGVAATVTFDIASGAVATSALVGVTGVAASAPNANGIAASGTGGTISIDQASQPPAANGLSCTPASVTAPGTSACTVTLTAPAPAGGLSVTLTSNNSNVSIPGSLAVPSGSSSAGFTATVAAVSTVQNASLTAMASGVSKTFSLSIAPALWSISGTISPSSSGSGARVTLGGAANAAVTADASGNYTFSGLLNGAYTVIPSKSGYTFSPTSQSVAINSANLTAISFTAMTQTWSLSGSISPSLAGSGVMVKLGGASSATATADMSGNYSFSGLANGTYTATPSESGYTFSPTSQTATVAGASLNGINFTANVQTASLAIDAKVFRNSSSGSYKVASPKFSTIAGNELLLAFISTGYAAGTNTTVTNVSGAGLTWVLVVRTNIQHGTSEIWRAFAQAPLSGVAVTARLSQSVASSMTVMSFRGADTSGTNGSGAIGSTASGQAPSGTPSATLITTRNNSWVFGVGNDYDQALARTPGPGQSLVDQALPNTSGVAVDAFWVQMQNSPTPLSGTSVTINDAAPTTDRYNLSIVEILPASTATAANAPILGARETPGRPPMR